MYSDCILNSQCWVTRQRLRWRLHKARTERYEGRNVPVDGFHRDDNKGGVAVWKSVVISLCRSKLLQQLPLTSSSGQGSQVPKGLQDSSPNSARRAKTSLCVSFCD